MDLGIKGLRVLVTAGANGIGLAIARAFVAEGAQVHTCDVDETALSALAASDPAISQSRCDVSDRAAVAEPVRRGDGKPRRARRAGQQCRRRGADLQGRGHEPRGLGPLSGDLPDRAIQLHAACGAAAAAEHERFDRQHLVGGGARRFCDARALCGGEMGRDRVHQIAVDRAWAGQYPRQRHPARPRRR